MSLNTGQKKLKKLYPELNDKQLKEVSKQVEDRLKSHGTVGKGFLSSLADKALRGLHGVTNLRCKKPNPNWKYIPKASEKHQVLKNGPCSYRGRFSGPGTHTLENTKELLALHGNNIAQAVQKSSYVSDVDKESHAHDIRYSLSNGDPKKIRDADMIFVRALNRIKGENINVLVPKNAMIAKMLAEDQGAIKVYSGEKNNYSPKDKKLLEDVLSHLEQQGFGAVDKDRPVRGGCADNDACDCDEKKGGGQKDEKIGMGQKDEKIGMGQKKKPPSAWIMHVKKYAKDNNIKYGEAMSKAKASYKK